MLGIWTGSGTVGTQNSAHMAWDIGIASGALTSYTNTGPGGILKTVYYAHFPTIIII